jgi:hypothetical protein
MKKLLLTLFLTISLYGNAQVFHIFMSNNIYTRDMIVAFTDSTTDGADGCCDAVDLGGINPGGDIWTTIGQQAYIINVFAPLTGVREIPIGAYSPDVNMTWTFYIPDAPVNTTLRIIDNGEEHLLPYTTSGDFYTGRFSLVFSPAPEFSHVKACTDTGSTCVTVSIPGGYDYWRVIKEGDFEDLYTGTDSTICGLTRGDYSLQLYRDDKVDGALFTIDWIDLNAVFSIPLTDVPITDPVIIPEVDIFTPYDSLRWDFGDGFSSFNDSNPVHVYQSLGVYPLKLHVYRDFCTLTYIESINVYQINAIPPIYIQKKGGRKYVYGLDGRLQKASQ